MRSTFLILPLLVAGCASKTPVAEKASLSLQPIVLATSPSSKLVETAYEVRSYREAADPMLRHEAHTVYRSTRVPIAVHEDLASVPRTAFPPASIAPLPASEELTAELATQRKITADIRSMQTSVADTEQKMQAQYSLLVRQCAEVLKLREQLESERSRIRSASNGQTATPPAPTVTSSETAPVKW